MSKAKTRSKSGKKAKRPVRSSKKASPIRVSARARLARGPETLDALTFTNPKLQAVTACVNAVLTANHNHWSDEDVMGDDPVLGYTQNTMPGFLSRVRQCLQPKHYVLNYDQALIDKCLLAKVHQARLLIYDKTT